MSLCTDLIGSFRIDPSGLRHYTAAGGYGMPDMLASALHLNQGAAGPAWFWFNGTYAPIRPDDTPVTLGARWWEWRAAHHAGTLLSKMEKWALGQ